MARVGDAADGIPWWAGSSASAFPPDTTLARSDVAGMAEEPRPATRAMPMVISVPGALLGQILGC